MDHDELVDPEERAVYLLEYPYGDKRCREQAAVWIGEAENCFYNGKWQEARAAAQISQAFSSLATSLRPV